MVSFIDLRNILLEEKTLVFAGAGGLFLLYKLISRLRRHSIKNIPGPQPKTAVGSILEFLNSELGSCETQWRKEYGNTYRLTGFLDERIVTSDPVTIHHIFSSGNFDRPEQGRPVLHLVTGPGILWAQDDDHRRQRRVMQPAFGISELKALVPLFNISAQRLSEHWKKQVEASDSGTKVIDVNNWLARATLDVIGNAAFDYDFGALEDDTHELTVAFKTLFRNAGKPTGTMLVVQTLWTYIPEWVTSLLANYLPIAGLRQMRKLGQLSKDTAANLVKEKIEARSIGKDGRDIMSLLVNANMAKDGKNKLSRDELLAQMATIILAGHETTATSLTWTLYLLSKRPDIQVKLRQDIKAAQDRAIEARGSPELFYQDFETMPYFTGFIKEMLRLYPAVRLLTRDAFQDDVLPLSEPLKTTDGTFRKEIPVSKGQAIIIDIYSYNRLKEVWGDDADQFIPERWLDDSKRKSTGLGVLANLMTFGMGPRNCIGWRFSVLEMQCFLVDFVTTFEFAPPPNAKRVKAEGGGIVAPILEGEEDKGRQMPLSFKVLDA